MSENNTSKEKYKYCQCGKVNRINNFNVKERHRCRECKKTLTEGDTKVKLKNKIFENLISAVFIC